MAIEHQNISLGEATAALAAAVAQDEWRDALLGHASGAWTLVEEFDSSGSTVHWVVVKNDHAISGQAVDFFVAIGRLASDGTLGLMVGETYDGSTNTLGKFVPRSSSSGYILAGGDYGFPAAQTWVLAAALPDNFNSYPFFEKITQAATERLFTSVEADYAVLNVNGKTMYIGAMTDLIVPKTGLVATPAIACVYLDSSSGSHGDIGGITNHPIAAADAPLNIYYPHALVPIINGQFIDLVLIQNQAFLTAPYSFGDRYQQDRVAASEIAGIMSAGFAGSNPGNRADKAGGLRAKFKGIRMTTGPYAAVNYDDIVVDGNKHVVIKEFSNLGFWTPYVTQGLPNGYNTVVKPMLTMDTGIAA